MFYFLTHNWAHYGHKPSALKNDLLSAFLIQSNLKEYFINNIHRLYIYVSHTSLNSISYCLTGTYIFERLVQKFIINIFCCSSPYDKSNKCLHDVSVSCHPVTTGSKTWFRIDSEWLPQKVFVRDEKLERLFINITPLK